MRHTASDAPAGERGRIYQALFQNAADAMFLVDVTPEGRFLFAEVNPAHERLTGRANAAAIGSQIIGDGSGVLLARLRDCVTTGEATNFDATFDTHAGPRRLNIALMPLRDESGDIRHIAGIARTRVVMGQAEDRLALLSFALNRVHEAAFLIDEAGCFQYVNDESCRVLGYAREELLRLGVADVDPDWPRERWPKHWRELKASGSLVFEGRHRRRDGQVVPVEINASYFEFGGCGYNLALVRDITGRKSAEALLHAREQEFRALAENAPDPILRYDREGHRLYANAAVFRLSGKPVSALLGHTPDDARLVVSKEGAKLLKCIRQVVETGRSVEEEVEFVEPGGKRHYFHNRFVPEWGQDNAVATVLSVSSDITSLVETERQLRALVENLPDMVFRFDTEGRHLYVSPQVTKACGFPPEHFLGKTALELTAPGDGQGNERVHEGIRTAVREGVPSVLETTWHLDGEDMVLEVRHIPEKDDNGDVVSVLGIARDITARKRAEDSLRKRKEELERFEKLVVGRELKMVELKRRIAELEKERASGRGASP